MDPVMFFIAFGTMAAILYALGGLDTGGQSTAYRVAAPDGFAYDDNEALTGQLEGARVQAHFFRVDGAGRQIVARVEGPERGFSLGPTNEQPVPWLDTFASASGSRSALLSFLDPHSRQQLERLLKLGWRFDGKAFSRSWEPPSEEGWLDEVRPVAALLAHWASLPEEESVRLAALTQDADPRVAHDALRLVQPETAAALEGGVSLPVEAQGAVSLTRGSSRRNPNAVGDGR